MFSDDEEAAIKDFLSRFGEVSDLKLLVTTAGVDSADVISPTSKKFGAIREILESAQAGGWSQNLLDALVEHFQEPPASPEKDDAVTLLQTIKQQMAARRAQGTTVGDLFQARIVRNRKPYINRSGIREAYKSLTEPGGSRIVVVDGDPGTGKSYSQQLPQYVTEMQEPKKFDIFYTDLSEGDKGIKAEALVRDILARWRSNAKIPTPPAQTAAYADELRRLLVSRLPKDTTWWIILDGLGKITPDPGLLNLVMSLANYLANNPINLRLVLLDPGDNPLPRDAALLAIPVELQPITLNDLVDDYFKPLRQAKAPPLPIDDALFSTKAQWALEQASKKPLVPKHLDGLETFLWQATRELGIF